MPARSCRCMASSTARSSTRLNSALVIFPAANCARASFRYPGRSRLPTTSLRNIRGSRQLQLKLRIANERERISINNLTLLHPVGNENIGLVRSFAIAIGSPYEALAVRREHREGVEIRVIGDAVETCSIFVDQ